ncbi:MAG: translational GTPase TypA [Spirochaetales bacterium]|nr:translational GTPase TypA [Spirochaetales bacterium]
MIYKNENIRNIAIIAHVDHGKTTLVDSMFMQAGIYRERETVQERVMDSMDLERERGITISAKNCAINWKGIKINIIDTPGHADFGGEVERGMFMADGAIILVDAAEGPLPQTRFVLTKAMAAGLELIIVVNKVDRPDARPHEVLNEIYDLLIDLGGDEALFDCPVFFANGREGFAGKDPDNIEKNLHSLLDTIVEKVPAPEYESEDKFQMLVSDLSYSDYLGRLVIGKVINGKVQAGEPLVRVDRNGKAKPLRVTKLQSYEGLKLVEHNLIEAGDIAVLAGIEEVEIGDTICSKENPEALPRIEVDEPTVSMTFYKNDSPLAGKDGKFVQGTKIKQRLEKETMTNVSIQIEADPNGDGIIVKGRGEFQMAIIVETMRREGYELAVGRPHIIFKKNEDGKKTEPIEHLVIDCDESYSGIVMEKLSKRKALMTSMDYGANGRVKIEFDLPSRALIGYRDEFLTDTRGTGIMSSYLKGYEEYKGEFPDRSNGSLIADRAGDAVAYALFNLEPRGKMFVKPGDPIYEGMIVGEHNRENDLCVNACKMKKLSNMRASGKDDAVILTPPVPITLEKAIQFIKEDELVEVTPKAIRMRKRYLSENERKIEAKTSKSE